MPSQFNLKNPVKLAVIGAGLIGSKHARIIKNHKASVLVGICDIDQTRSSIADSLKVPFYKDPDEMLLKQKPQGVIIATPSSDHESMARICVARSVNILIEKPIAETAESANNIIKLSHEGGVKILVGHHRRHSPYIKKARSILMNGEIGRLVAVSMLWTLLKPPEYLDIQWRGNKPSGGPVLINLIHELDILRYICGEINQIFAFSSSSTRNLPVEDSLSISIYFRNGAVGSIIASDSAPSPWSYESTTKENTFYFPTDEKVPLLIPDPINPRYSYAAGKILSEIMLLNTNHFKRAIIFRPHNIYGPNMGYNHVIPEVILKTLTLKKQVKIEGTGLHTRSFCFIDDFIEAFNILLKKGKNKNIYNIGTQNEIKIKELAKKIITFSKKNMIITTSKEKLGSPSRRCPNISKIRKLGFKPRINLNRGLKKTYEWYLENLKNEL